MSRQRKPSLWARPSAPIYAMPPLHQRALGPALALLADPRVIADDAHVYLATVHAVIHTADPNQVTDAITASRCDCGFSAWRGLDRRGSG